MLYLISKYWHYVKSIRCAEHGYEIICIDNIAAYIMIEAIKLKWQFLLEHFVDVLWDHKGIWGIMTMLTSKLTTKHQSKLSTLNKHSDCILKKQSFSYILYPIKTKNLNSKNFVPSFVFFQKNNQKLRV